MKDNFDDFDSDIFDLATTSQKRNYAAPKERDTSSVEISDGRSDGYSSISFRVPPAGRDKTGEKQIRTSRYSGACFEKQGTRRYPDKSRDGEVIREYDLDGPFVRHVTVQSWPAPYSFYEKFVRDAAVSHTRQGKKAPHVPFFSYIPQYTQLNAPQWAYYLYMKQCARDGICLNDADFSYVLLYIYEIINLEGIIAPEDGAALLGTVWILYRWIHPMLDKYMAEWMADYCLLYDVPLPKVLLPVIADIAAKSTLKEFYADVIVTTIPRHAGRMVRLALSDYDVSRSRYASKLDNFTVLTEEVFDSAALEQLSEKKGLFDKKLRRQITVTRDAFCGSLCAASVKKKITLTLDTPFRAPETRRVVTEMMKGAENIVRARMGVKARLSAPVLEGKSSVVSARTEEERTYLSFYETPAEDLSADAAAKIERESWKNAELLAQDELIPEGEAELDTGLTEINGAVSGGSFEQIEENENTEIPTECHSLSEAIGETLARLLKTAMEGGSFSTACREAGVFADSAASRINECAMDFIGDIVLEASGTDYKFIEDYRNDIE